MPSQCRKLWRFLAIWLVLLAAEIQAQTATVIGTVTHRNNTPAVNILVVIAGRSRYTDVAGRYRIDGVPFGRQNMRIYKGREQLSEAEVEIRKLIVRLDQTIP